MAIGPRILRGARILVTGPTSQVAQAVLRGLAPSNRVYGLGRLRKDGERRALEAAGVEPIVGGPRRESCRHSRKSTSCSTSRW